MLLVYQYPDITSTLKKKTQEKQKMKKIITDLPSFGFPFVDNMINSVYHNLKPSLFLDELGQYCLKLIVLKYYFLIERDNL